MISRKKLYELFETKWLMMPQNPGGKSAYLQGYLLGFTGTVNITEALVDGKAVIMLKIGSDEVQALEVNFSNYSPEALTPANAVKALNSAGFTGCNFSVDEESGRIKLAANKKVRFIQIYSDLAAALHFGDCRLNEGKGCYILPSFDGDLKSVAETEQWDEDTVIENESPRGTLLKHTTPGKRTGTQIVITDRLDSRAMKQMVNGGIWISGTSDRPDTYEPPAGVNVRRSKVDVLTFSEVFEKNTNVEGDEAIVRERMYIGCVGRKLQTGGAGSWKDGEATLTAPDYIGVDGAEHASPKESDWTKDQWEALQMNEVIVRDWESYGLTEQGKPIPVTGISLNKTSVTITVGYTETLIPTITPNNASNQEVLWRSGDEDVATVNDQGAVTAVAAGSCTITVTTIDGEFTAECEVTVF